MGGLCPKEDQVDEPQQRQQAAKVEVVVAKEEKQPDPQPATAAVEEKQTEPAAATKVESSQVPAKPDVASTESDNNPDEAPQSAPEPNQEPTPPATEPEQQAQPEPEQQPEPAPVSEPEPQAQPEPEEQAQPEPDAEPQQPDPQPEPAQAEPQPEPEEQAQPEPQPEQQAEPEPAQAVEPEQEQSEPEQAQASPAAEPEPEPEPEQQPDPEPQEPDAQPEQEPDAQPEPQPEQAPATEPEQPPEPQSDPEPGQAAEPEPEQPQSEPEAADPEQQPEPEQQAQPEPEPEQSDPQPAAAAVEEKQAEPAATKVESSEVQAEPEPAVDVQEDEKTADADVVLVRKELRSMSQEETDRFFDCVDKMLENKDGPGTSEFYRCASYHGQPAPIYCQHGRETFPGWHRIYMMDFEKALQAADKALGRDGDVFLPYWDWTVAQEDGLPAAIRERFKGWPDDFWPVELRQESRTKELRRNSDQGVTAQLRAWQVVRSVTDSLLATQHWAHASTQFSGQSNYPSLENPHNDLHVIVGGNGGQMGSVAWAAYDIAFWLHHCNVDRIYESYLRLEPDSHDEFRNFQTDLFGSAYAPFEKADGTKYTSKDTFDTKALGYAYADLFEPPTQNQLREPPTFIVFSGVKVSEFESKCYQIHAYVVDAANEDEFKEPATINDIDYESPNYAGGAGIFGRGMECQNCATRPPHDIAIDISDTLRAAGIDRYSAKAKIYVLETTEDSEELQALSATPLPEPTITGPLFSNRDAADLLDEDDKATNNPNEVEALQRFLQKFGYYAPERKVDGDFGPYTRQAVVDYQEATGDLTVDGVAGPLTRNAIVKKKRCANLDPFAKNEVTDTAVDFAQAAYAQQKEIKYSIGAQPGYLKRDQVEAAIAKACSEYDAATSLSFVNVDDEKDADIKFSFTLFSREDDPTRYDGVGGVLGRGGTGYVEFDMAERWTIGMGDADEQLSDLGDRSTWYRGQPVISLYYTALHELGHALGLMHSKDPNDVMSPWYNPKQTQLSANDAEAVKQIVDSDE